MSFNDNEKDDFWDLKKLMPTRKTRPNDVNSKANNMARVADYQIHGTVKPNDECRFTTLADTRSVDAYIPQNRFIRKITLTAYKSGFDFYGAFRNAALLYFDFKAPKCDFVSYYSYMPQYTQLTAEQKAFYFYFRGEIRKKNYIKTDYSYLYLYIYEVINLPDKIPPKEALKILTDLWCAYRSSLPKIDEKLVIWVRDYCILHGLQAPTDKLRDFIFDIISGVPLCEFYISGFDAHGRAPSSVICSYLSDYDWRRGKFYGGESAKIYEKLMLGALDELIGYMWLYGKIGAEPSEYKTVSFTLFQGALSTQMIKRNATVEYSPLSADAGVRADITDAVRYIENKLRALLGIKSRLLVKSQIGEYKRIIDGYFDKILKKEIAQRKKSAVPEYERLYVAESTELSGEGADEIERLSWTTTARLTEGSEDAPIFIEKEQEAPVNNTCADSATFSEEELSAVRNSLTSGIMRNLPLAERINEEFIDIIGDVVYESIDDGFMLIEDYREDVEAWLMNLMT